MIESATQKDYFHFQDLSEDEKKKRGILGRLYGPCADLIKDTRNGRHYSDELWEKVFKNDLVKEMLRNGGIPGEVEHPQNRTEVCPEKIAIMMPEAPKKDKNGKLVAYFDILDTPCGRIAYQLAKYGFNWGISSRGEGDIKEGFGDFQEVDPDTYEFTCFDLVLLPAVTDARLKMVESMDSKLSKLKKSLTESLQKASPEERKVMNETLQSLNINLDSNNAAENIGADVIKQLQESLKQNKQLQGQVKSLQEKLSVCNAKEAKSTEELQGLKSRISTLETLNEEAKANSEKLNEQLSQMQAVSKRQEMKIKILSEQHKDQEGQVQSLNESLQSRKDKMRELSEALKTERSKNEKEISSLRESLEDARQDSKLLKEKCDQKIEKATTLVEHYKKVALIASNRYIEAKAKMIGVTPASIKSKLHEGYSFNDIDKACEELQDYQLRVGSLPFDVDNNKQLRVKIKESTEPIKPKSRFDDDIDENLVNLANKYGK